MTCPACEDGRKPVLNGLCTNPACEFHPPARPPASGSAMYLQRGNYPAFNCPWCGKPVQPFSKTQATCGVMGCSEKQRQASRERVRRLRSTTE